MTVIRVEYEGHKDDVTKRRETKEDHLSIGVKPSRVAVYLVMCCTFVGSVVNSLAIRHQPFQACKHSRQGIILAEIIMH